MHAAPAPLSLEPWLVPWTWEPSLVIGLLLTAAGYGWGVYRLWQRAGVGRGLRRGQVLAYAGALVGLILALMSPLATSSHVLFSAHMVQHIVLINLVAPLLVLADPGYAWLWAAPRGWRRGLARGWRRRHRLRAAVHGITSPLAVWVIFALSLWVWHIPRFYQAALINPLIHELEHLSFLGAAILFWWRILDLPRAGRTAGRPSRHTVSAAAYGTGIAMSFTTMLHSGMLGALITFSPTPWYPNYITNTAAWGIGPLADQQLAGVIMWVPGGMVYLAVTVLLLAAWLRRMEQADLQQAGLVTRPIEPG